MRLPHNLSSRFWDEVLALNVEVAGTSRSMRLQSFLVTVEYKSFIAPTTTTTRLAPWILVSHWWVSSQHLEVLRCAQETSSSSTGVNDPDHGR
jgi:hypothetical protein